MSKAATSLLEGVLRWSVPLTIGAMGLQYSMYNGKKKSNSSMDFEYKNS